MFSPFCVLLYRVPLNSNRSLPVAQMKSSHSFGVHAEFSFLPSCFNAPQGLGKNRFGESDSLGSYCHVRKGVCCRGKQQSWLPNVGWIQQCPRDTFQWETSKPDKTQQELPICSPPLLFTKLLKTYLPAWGAKSLLLPCRWWEQPGACVRSAGVMGVWQQLGKQPLPGWFRKEEAFF